VDRRAYSAVVLAGGAGRRWGGPGKPVAPVAGQPMLHRVLTAVADAAIRIVVGPPELPLPAGVLLTRERPAGGGPVAGAGAGLALVPPDVSVVALLAADLPLLDPAAVTALRDALVPGAGGVPGAGSPSADSSGPADGSNRVGPAGRPDVAVYVDEAGRRQTLCGLWRTDALRSALSRVAARRGGLAGAPVHALFDAVRVAEVHRSGDGPPPWFDCDTDADRRSVEEWTR
jgi:molybdopterin-guanine dinucleotide biosynthesis protein A